MTPDYDLSNLQTDHADLWIYLDAIYAEIFADHPEHWASPLTLVDCTQRCSPFCDREAGGGTQQSKTGSGFTDIGLGNTEVN